MNWDFVRRLDLESNERIIDLLEGEFSRQARGPYGDILAATLVYQFGLVNKRLLELVPVFRKKLTLAHRTTPHRAGKPSGNNFLPKLNSVCNTWERRSDQIEKLLWLCNKLGVKPTTTGELASIRALHNYVTQSLADNVDASTAVARFVGGLEPGLLALLEAVRCPLINKYRPQQTWLTEHLHLLQQEVEWITNPKYNRISAIPPQAIELYDGIVRSTSDYEFIRFETWEVLRIVLQASLEMSFSVSTTCYPDPTRVSRFGNLTR